MLRAQSETALSPPVSDQSAEVAVDPIGEPAQKDGYFQDLLAQRGVIVPDLTAVDVATYLAVDEPSP